MNNSSARHGMIVLATASSGYGHLQAADNVAAALREARWSSSIDIVNVYDLMPPWQRRILEGGWQHVSESPGLANFYRIFHRHLVTSTFVAQAFQRQISSAAERLLMKLHTNRIAHFVAFHSVALLIGVQCKMRTDCRLALVATDFVLHSNQCHELVDCYFVPPEIKRVGSRAVELAEGAMLQAIGIPVASDFRIGTASTQASEPYDGFHVLVSFGGTGYRGEENLPLIADIIKHSGPEVRFSIVTGRNEYFRAAASQRLACFVSSGQVEILGFVANMASLMSRAHLLLGKAGGLTLTEALCVGLPIVVVDVLPGQEDYNALFVREQGLGLCTRNVREIVGFIEQLQQGDCWVNARARAISFGRPESSKRIAAALGSAKPHGISYRHTQLEF